jgi:stress-induced-phosphoprotein 1
MSAASFKEAGNKALQAGKFDEAIKAYSDAIAIDPSDHVFFSNRSAAYLSKGDAEHALADGNQCITLSPSWPKGYSRKGAALHALKRYEEALESYNAGLDYAPADAGLKAGVAEVTKILESRSPSPGSGGLGGLFGPQLMAKLAGHPKFGPRLGDPAFRAKIQMFQTNPQMMMQDPEMMEVLQVMLEGMGGGKGGADFDEPSSPSSNPYSRSPAPAPTPAPAPAPEPEANLTDEERAQKAIKAKAVAAKERGNALYKEKKFEEAIAAYDEAFATDSTNMMFLNNKAAVLIEMDRCAEAIELCERALEVGKQNRASFDDRAKVFQRIAGAYTKMNDLPAAIAAYGKSQMEKYDKAVERKMKNLELDFKKLEKQKYINPELAVEAKERGNVFFRDGKFPEAITEYEEAIKRDPTNPAYHNNLSAAFLKLGLFNDAKKEVEKSLELDRNYVKAWAKKGDIEFFMKE